MDQRYHFISGLPRSGSTLLSAILRQNPRFHAAMSSPVASLFQSMLNTFSVQNENAAHVSQQQRRSLLRGLFDNYYIEHEGKEVIFDTSRAWTTRMGALVDLFPESKVICCVRNVAWIMDSLERLYQKNPYENTKFFNDDIERNTVYSRVDTLGQRNRLVGYAWSALKEAFYGEHAASLLVVDYDLLTQAPERTLPLIYQFLGEEAFEHDFSHVEYDATEFDKQLGVEGLHRIAGPVVHRPRRTLLPPDLFENYAHMDFWRDVEGSRASVITASPKANPAAEDD
jgi:sulfotransferase